MAQRTASTTLRNSMMPPSQFAHNVPVVHGNGRGDQIAPDSTQPRKRPLLVGTGKLAVSGYVRRKNGRELPGLRHGSPFTTKQSSTINRSGLVRGLVMLETAHQQSARRNPSPILPHFRPYIEVERNGAGRALLRPNMLRGRDADNRSRR